METIDLDALGKGAMEEIRACLRQEGLTQIERRWAAYGVWRLWCRFEPMQAMQADIITVMEDAA